MYLKILLIALIAALMPARAWPLPPDQPPEIELFIAGSSAQDESIENLMRLRAGIPGTPNICLEGSLDVYRGTLDGVSKRVYYCLTSGNIEGVAAGRRLAVYKSSAGSGEGVEPVALARPIAFIDLANLSDDDACQTPARVLYTGNLASYSDRRNCGLGGKTAVPDIGVADIEPALLGKDAGRLIVESKSQIVWGLPVSKNFRNALQAVQGLVPAEVAHDARIRDTEENMPSLTSTQLASIFSGAITNWGQLYDRDGNAIYLSPELPVSPPEHRNLSGTTPGAYQPTSAGGQHIYICRRTASSGTQAAYEIHYLRRRCVADAPHFVAADDGSSHRDGGDSELLVRRPDPAGRVFAGRGTSSVRACLDAHNDFNRWAIGIFSTENIGNNASREFRHIKVDGHAPTLLNAHHGLWTHVSEPTLQWHADSRDERRGREVDLTLQFIRRNVGQPRVLSSLNTAFEHPWGLGGYLALPNKGYETAQVPVTHESLAEYPISGTARNRDSMRSCHVPIIRGESSAAM